jgi:hypothetical protein
MPFNKPLHLQAAVSSVQATSFSCPTPAQTTRSSSVPIGPTNILLTLRPGVRPSTNTMPGLNSPFTASSGGARFTVSRAAGRGNIPGAMGSREVAAPLTNMGPPLVPITPGSSQSSARTEGETGIKNGFSGQEQEKEGRD